MSSVLRRLVLFDIDGTLLHGGSLWSECFLQSIAHHHPERRLPAISFGGKTDLQICRELLAAAGVPASEIEGTAHRIMEGYLSRVAEQLRARSHEVKVLPGVTDLLNRLQARPEVAIGLLTGNLREGAALKLAAAGLAPYFGFGVYCDDHHDRYQLPAIAVERAHKSMGRRFEGKEVVIIGDTIHDVNCGKSIGVRTIAVGTNRRVPTEELLAQNPDYYFRDLSSTLEVLGAIMEDV